MTANTTMPGALEGVDRTLTTIELVASRGSMTATQIATELDVSKASAFRLARALTARDWLVQDADRSYRLGPAIRSIAARSGDSQLTVAAFYPLMERLYEATGETIHLTRLVGRHVVYLEQIVSAKPVRSVAVMGARSPAHAVSPGLSQLSLLPEEDLAWFLQRPLTRMTPTTITDPARLRRELEDTRERGFAVNRGGHRPDVGGVSATIAQANHTGPLCALSICAPLYRLEPDVIATFGALVSQVALELSTETQQHA